MLHDLGFISGREYTALVDEKLDIKISLKFHSARISTTRAVRFEFYKMDGTSIFLDTQELINYFGVKAA